MSGKALYFECANGISGDMAVAALLDAGADQNTLLQALHSLPVQGFRTEIRRVTKAGLDCCDFVLVMSVFAGFGGQKFIESTYERIRTLKSEIDRRGLDVRIEVDGGVSPANSSALAAAGADILVAGSAVFKSDDPVAVVKAMK